MKIVSRVGQQWLPTFRRTAGFDFRMAISLSLIVSLALSINWDWRICLMLFARQLSDTQDGQNFLYQEGRKFNPTLKMEA